MKDKILIAIILGLLFLNTPQGFGQQKSNFEYQLSLNYGSAAPISSLNLDTTFLGIALQWDIAFSIVPKRWKFIGLNCFTGQITYLQDANKLQLNFVESSSIFSVNGLTNFSYGIRPFFYLHNRNWRTQLQFNLLTMERITPPSFSAEGINNSGVFEKRVQSGNIQSISKNIFKDFPNTDFSLYLEYRLNKNLGINVKAAYTSFTADVNNVIIKDGRRDSYINSLGVNAIQYGLGLTYTLNSKHQKPWNNKKKTSAIQTEIERDYLPNEQSLFVNVVNIETKEKIVVSFSNTSTESITYLSLKNFQTGKDTVISLLVSEIKKLKIKHSEDGILLQSNDFLASIGQSKDILFNTIMLRKINEHSVFYELSYKSNTGNTYNAQALTDPIPLIWVLVAIIVASNV